MLQHIKKRVKNVISILFKRNTTKYNMYTLMYFYTLSHRPTVIVVWCCTFQYGIRPTLELNF